MTAPDLATLADIHAIQQTLLKYPVALDSRCYLVAQHVVNAAAPPAFARHQGHAAPPWLWSEAGA
jgi:hypothetical protein